MEAYCAHAGVILVCQKREVHAWWLQACCWDLLRGSTDAGGQAEQMGSPVRSAPRCRLPTHLASISVLITQVCRVRKQSMGEKGFQAEDDS